MQIEMNKIVDEDEIDNIEHKRGIELSLEQAKKDIQNLNLDEITQEKVIFEVKNLIYSLLN